MPAFPNLTEQQLEDLATFIEASPSGGCSRASRRTRVPGHHRVGRALCGAPVRGSHRGRRRGRRRLLLRDRGARDGALRRRDSDRTRCSTCGRREGVTVHPPERLPGAVRVGLRSGGRLRRLPARWRRLGTLAAGAQSDSPIHGASVAIKEGRRLVLMPRETPLSTIHLDGMLRLRQAGAVILFLAPGFYHRPRRSTTWSTSSSPGASTSSASRTGWPSGGVTREHRDRRGCRRARFRDVRPDLTGLRPHEPRHDRRAGRRWRRLTVERSSARDHVLDAAAGRRSGARRACGGRRRDRRTSPTRCWRGRARKSSETGGCTAT